MVDGFTNEHDSMVRGAQAVQDAHDKIKGLLGQLQGDVEAMRGGWKGTASNSFGNAHEMFNQQGQKLNGALDNMHQALVATGQAYAQSEEEGSSSFSNIASQL